MPPATADHYPLILLAQERFTASFGPNVPVTIAAGEDSSKPAVYILTPHMAAPAGVGFVHTLSEDDAVNLGAAIYSSLTDAGRTQFLAALLHSGDS